MYCKGKEHFVSPCLVKGADSPVGREFRVSQTTSSPYPLRPLLRACFLLPGSTQELATLTDSGADACIISGELVSQLELANSYLSPCQSGSWMAIA